MKRAVIIIIFFLLAGSMLNAQGKRQLFHKQEEVAKAAKSEFDHAMQAPEGEIYVWAKENNIEGKYTMDITVVNRGKIATVFCSDNKGGSIKHQNKLKDFIKEFRFSFKTPKSNRYKFSYTFNFKNPEK